MRKTRISYYDMFYLFLFGCFFGWIIEGIWTLIKKGLLINHSALVIGPFNIIYGIGAVVLTLCLYRIKDKNVITIFGASFAVGSILEYVMSFLMEKIVGFVAWNYSHKPFNLNGRICLTYSIFWGILGIFWIKGIYPLIQKFLNKFASVEKIKLMNIAIIFLIFDVLLTLGAINRGKEYEENIPPSNKVEEIYDKYFSIDYLNNMFNNRWNRK